MKKFINILVIILVIFSSSVPLKALAENWTFSETNNDLSTATLTTTETITGGCPGNKTFNFTGVGTTVFASNLSFSEVWRGKDTPNCFADRPTISLFGSLNDVFTLGTPGGNWAALAAVQTVSGNSFAEYDRNYKFYELIFTMPISDANNPSMTFVAQIRLPQYGTNNYGPMLAQGTQQSSNIALNLQATGNYNEAPITNLYTGPLAVFVYSTSQLKNADGTSSTWWYYKELNQSQFTAGSGYHLIPNTTYATYDFTKTFTATDFDTKNPVPPNLVNLSIKDQIIQSASGPQNACGATGLGGALSNIGDIFRISFCNLDLFIYNFAESFTKGAVTAFKQAIGIR